MLNGGRHKFAILDHRLQHLRHRLLFKDTVLLAIDRQANVDGAALSRCDFSAEAVLGEVDLARVSGIDLDHGCGAGDLEGEGGG